MYVYEELDTVGDFDYSFFSANESSSSTYDSVAGSGSSTSSATGTFFFQGSTTNNERGDETRLTSIVNNSTNQGHASGDTQYTSFNTAEGGITFYARASGEIVIDTTLGTGTATTASTTISIFDESSSTVISVPTEGTMTDAPTFGGSYTYTTNSDDPPLTGNTTFKSSSVLGVTTFEGSYIGFVSTSTRKTDDDGSTFTTSTDRTSVLTTASTKNYISVETYSAEYYSEYLTTLTVNPNVNFVFNTVIAPDDSFDLWELTGSEGAATQVASRIGDARKTYFWTDYNEISTNALLGVVAEDIPTSVDTGTAVGISTFITSTPIPHTANNVVRQLFFASAPPVADTRTASGNSTETTSETYETTSGNPFGEFTTTSAVTFNSSFVFQFVDIVSNPHARFATASGNSVDDLVFMTTGTASATHYSVGTSAKVVGRNIWPHGSNIHGGAGTVIAVPMGAVYASIYGNSAGLLNVFSGVTIGTPIPSGCISAEIMGFAGFEENQGTTRPTVVYMDLELNAITGTTGNHLAQSDLQRLSFGLPSIYGSTDDEWYRFDTALNMNDGLTAIIGFTGRFPIGVSKSATRTTSNTSEASLFTTQLCVGTASYSSKENQAATFRLTLTYTTSQTTNSTRPDSAITITDYATGIFSLKQSINAASALNWTAQGFAVGVYGQSGNTTNGEFAQFANCVLFRTFVNSNGVTSSAVNTVRSAATASAASLAAVRFSAEPLYYSLQNVKTNRPNFLNFPAWQPPNINGN